MTNGLQPVTREGAPERSASCAGSEVSSGAPRRILALTNMLPYPPTSGGQMRDWEVLRALASLGCEIHLLSLGQAEDLNGQREEILRVCKTVEVVPHPRTSLSNGRDYLGRLRVLPASLPYSVARFQSHGMRERIGEWLESGRVDAVLSNMAYPAANLPAALSVPLIVNCHNVEHLILRRYLQWERSQIRRAYARMECRKLENWEKEICSRADLLLACSDHDRAVMEKLCPRVPVAVVPNAIDLDRYVPSRQSDAATLLYTGGMDWFPNRDAVEFFVTAILPELRCLVPEAKFVVAGRRGPEEFHRRLAGASGLEFRGPVPDMPAEIAKAAVCVVPLRIGSGTRLKILEAAAMGKPIVSTRIGAEGLRFAEGTEILLADQPEQFARVTADLLADSDRCAALGLAARSAVEKHYGLPALRLALREALRALSREAIPAKRGARA